MKQIIILILLTIPLGCRSQNWEWISNQVDVENNADPNKTVVQMTAVYDYHKMEMEAKMMTDKMKKTKWRPAIILTTHSSFYSSWASFIGTEI